MISIKLTFGITEVICKAINWITLPLIAFIVSSDRYGSAVLIYAYITIFSTLMLFGQGRSILKYYRSGQEWITSVVVVILVTSGCLFFIFAVC